ncbi:tyrosine-type recombinase/integrase [Baekduia soli]|uniref:tyrosine-type recombinase/integrase n=1 Tax=Baekduia soli TaxID=496014 RepID=UPI00165202A2|nr:site-specific integrase [Baekduia soli]
MGPARGPPRDQESPQPTCSPSPQLREHLAAHRLSQPPGTPLVFARPDGLEPWTPPRIQEASDHAWKAAKLTRVAPHDCRHTYASLMIAAGVNAKALCDYMGHSSITITYDRYGHLMPGNETEAAELLERYLTRAAVS